ncbi:MAG: hypothetical protein PHQ98_00785 [Candidatus ainarchaeum sp.]|nr:hypothetical protein [Candidatus ainarchaeum sp.]
MENLLFGQKFPFSNIAKEKLKTFNIMIDDVDEQVIKKAALMILKANSNQKYFFEMVNPSEELLKVEIMSFTVAKILISLIKTPNIKEKFCDMVRKDTFEILENTEHRKDVCINLSNDLGIKFELVDDNYFFVKIKILDFLDIYFKDEESKLINKSTEEGFVYLSINDFARFLSEKAYKKVFDSLPLPKETIPKKFLQYAKSIDDQLGVIQQKRFDERLVGKVYSDLFPPCINDLYTQQAQGKKLSHVARLTLASFLYQIGMNKTEMLVLFSKSPDYDEKIAKYQIDKVFEKELSAPGCRKIADYGLKVKECDKCKYKHPVQWYISNLRIKNRIKNNNVE